MTMLYQNPGDLESPQSSAPKQFSCGPIADYTATNLVIAIMITGHLALAVKHSEESEETDLPSKECGNVRPEHPHFSAGVLLSLADPFHHSFKIEMLTGSTAYGR